MVKWIEYVFQVRKVFNKIILVKIQVDQRVIYFLSVPHNAVLGSAIRDRLYDQLHNHACNNTRISILIPSGDCNGHGGRTGSGYKRHTVTMSMTSQSGY